MEAKHTPIQAAVIMDEPRSYSAFIEGYQGTAVAWDRIEQAARGNVVASSGYAAVDVRRKADGQWFSVFADPEFHLARRRAAIVDDTASRLPGVTPSQVESLLAGTDWTDDARVERAIAAAREKIAAL